MMDDREFVDGLKSEINRQSDQIDALRIAVGALKVGGADELINLLAVAIKALEYCADPDFVSISVGQDYISGKTMIIAERALDKIKASKEGA